MPLELPFILIGAAIVAHSGAGVKNPAMKLAVLPGDGIGPEITEATLAVLSAADRRFHLDLQMQAHPVGLAALRKSGTTCPAGLLDACRRADAVLLGPLDQVAYPPKAEGGINVSGELRIQLDLYANIRPSRSRAGLPHWGRTAMDLVIVRENTEGFYSDRNMHLGVGEFMPTPDLALSVRKITAHASRRIAQSAFAMAQRRRRKVTAVHKANVIRMSEALFLREVRAVAQQFPEVSYDEQLVDSMAALLVRDAARFDVVLTTNMFGDILSDEAAELSGSLGLGAAINAGERYCMAQAQHGSAPDIAGQGVANPASLILSAAMLLEWLGGRHSREPFLQASSAIERAVDHLLAKQETRTRDLGGALGTGAFAAAVAARVLGESGAR
jgi:isocitrate/isopropylmalate dehydrogenase